MGQQIAQSVMDTLAAVALSVASVLLPPTIMLLMLKMFLPALGEPLWQAWVRLVVWLIMAPIRVVQFLSREAFSRHRR